MISMSIFSCETYKFCKERPDQAMVAGNGRIRVRKAAGAFLVHGRIRGRIGAVFALLAAAGRLTAGNPVDRFLYAIERLRRFCRLHPKIIFDGIIETEEAGFSLQGFGHEQSGLNTAGFGLLEKYANQHFEAVEIDQDGPSL